MSKAQRFFTVRRMEAGGESYSLNQNLQGCEANRRLNDPANTVEVYTKAKTRLLISGMSIAAAMSPSSGSPTAMYVHAISQEQVSSLRWKP